MTPSTWQFLGTTPPSALTPARLLAHHAVQLPANMARQCLPNLADDSHTNLGWAAQNGALLGHPLPLSGTNDAVQVGVRFEPFGYVIVEAAREPITIALDGKSLAAGAADVAASLLQRGLVCGTPSFDTPYKIPVLPAAFSRIFDVAPTQPALSELGRWYGNAAAVLESTRERLGIQGEARCWPHHFDIAALGVIAEGNTVGFGLSPGDASYDQPYFYVTPWPYPQPGTSLPTLKTGFWHPRDWTGCVLPGDEVAAMDTPALQEQLVSRFLEESFLACRGLLNV